MAKVMASFIAFLYSVHVLTSLFSTTGASVVASKVSSAILETQVSAVFSRSIFYTSRILSITCSQVTTPITSIAPHVRDGKCVKFVENAQNKALCHCIAIIMMHSHCTKCLYIQLPDQICEDLKFGYRRACHINLRANTMMNETVINSR